MSNFFNKECIIHYEKLFNYNSSKVQINDVTYKIYVKSDCSRTVIINMLTHPHKPT